MNDFLHYIGGEKYREPLTVSNAANMLLRLSNKWIVVASSLGLPSSAIDVINVSSRRDNQVALRKVMEWWFMNTANPEWNQIHQVLNQGMPLILLIPLSSTASYYVGISPYFCTVSLTSSVIEEIKIGAHRMLISSG